ncbi:MULTISPECIES: hypothetical protein [Cysteiniphilum]|uniref:hypothetical protein n=1 Tax=Cysteiniphilum TaxID=2056696 RepID=UPI001780E0CB|nr:MULTISPECIES: hypothetical protein [Cysteiniphilum]
MAFKKLDKKNKELEAFKNEPIETKPKNDIHIDIHSDLQIKLPWLNHNKNAVKPKKQFILKLNDYYHSALTHFSNPEEGVSMQKIVNDILIPALDEMIEKEENKK